MRASRQCPYPITPDLLPPRNREGASRRVLPGHDYRSSDRTAALVWFACAKAAMPLWFRMLNRVMLADSSAMFASRMRLSAALVFTICDCARLMANWTRFSRIPTLFCTLPSEVIAADTSASTPCASDASANDVVARPSVVLSTALMPLSLIWPSVALDSALMKTEKSQSASRPATLAWRSISSITLAYSSDSDLIALSSLDEDACVASVAR